MLEQILEFLSLLMEYRHETADTHKYKTDYYLSLKNDYQKSLKISD